MTYALVYLSLVILLQALAILVLVRAKSDVKETPEMYEAAKERLMAEVRATELPRVRAGVEPAKAEEPKMRKPRVSQQWSAMAVTLENEE